MPRSSKSPNIAGGCAEMSAYELKQSALGGFMWMSMGNGARAVVKIGVLAVLAHLLTPEAFGLVAAAGVVIWFSMIFSNLGVGPALIQRRDIEPAHVATGFIFSVGFGVVIGGLIFFFAPSIAGFFRMPDLTHVLRVMSVIFPIAGLAMVAECLLQRELKFAVIAVVELISYTVGYGVIGVSMAFLSFGVWALVAAEIAKTVIKTCLFLRVVPRPARLRFNPAAFRDLLRFGSGYTITGFSTYLASQGDSFIVGRFLGAAALGVYGRAYELMMVPAQSLGVILDKILFPTLARVTAEPAQLRLAYRRCTALVALLVIPISASTAVLAPEIIRALLGPRWEEAIVLLQILAVGMYFRIGYMVGQSVAYATGAVTQTAWRNTVHAALIVSGAAIGQFWGLPGVAIGVVIAITVNFALVLQLGVKVTGIRWIELARAHAHAGLLATLLGLEAWAVASAGRIAEQPAIVTLFLAACVLAVSALCVVRFAPQLLGEDGLWMVETLHRNVPARFQRFLRKAPVR